MSDTIRQTINDRLTQERKKKAHKESQRDRLQRDIDKIEETIAELDAELERINEG